MDKYFVKSRAGDMTSWFGHPMMYDYGLYVNRTYEETKESHKYYTKFNERLHDGKSAPKN